jgi:hypothetical protein
VRVVAAEQRARIGAGPIAEVHVREPPVADLLPQHAQRVVLAEKLRRRIVGILDQRVHDDEGPQAAGAAQLPADVEDVLADTAYFVRDRELVGKGVADERLIGPQQDLIVVVRVRLVELLRDGERVERIGLREPLGNRARSRAVAARHVHERDVARAARRDADDRVGDVDRVAELHLDAAVGQQRRLHVVAASESNARTLHQVTCTDPDAALTKIFPVPRRIEIGEERRDARRSRPACARGCGRCSPCLPRRT